MERGSWLQTKTDAGAFAVRVRASHKLEMVNGKKDEGRRTQDAGRGGNQGLPLPLALAGKLWQIEQIDELLKNGKLKQQFCFFEGERLTRE